MRKVSFIVITLLVFIVATSVVHKAILGGASFIALRGAPDITGAVSQAMDTTGGNVTVPTANKDYTLQGVRYFDNKMWVAAYINPTKHSSNITKALVVLHQQQGIYQVALGPGTSFDSSVLISLPTDVGQYLSQQGALYAFSYQ